MERSDGEADEEDGADAQVHASDPDLAERIADAGHHEQEQERVRDEQIDHWPAFRAAGSGAPIRAS